MGDVAVLIADAQPLFAQSLAVALSRRNDMKLLRVHPRTGHDTVVAVERHSPDVALVDFNLPGMYGPAVARAIRTRASHVKVINLSWFHNAAQVAEALDSGVVGFLPKTASLEQVEQAIQLAVAGERLVFTKELARHLEAIGDWERTLDDMVDRLANLTPRELQVLRMLAGGLVVDDIAQQLHVTTDTARSHVRSILSKTDTHSQLSAVAIARELGIVP